MCYNLANYMENLTHNNQIGKLGEDLACRFLVKHGYEILERNYLKKCGEIDIVAKKGDEIHFVEVKSVSREIKSDASSVRKVFEMNDDFRPEDNIHPWKIQKLAKTVLVYLEEKSVSDETEWMFDIVTVYIDAKRRISKVFIMEDIIL